MEWLQIIILSIVQGVTEFLPVSSSAHLILVPRLLGWPDQGLAYDISAHVGSLLAVVIYFRKSLGRMLRSMFHTVDEKACHDRRLFLYITVATLPVILVGSLLHDEVETYLRSPLIIATTTMGFGVLLILANYPGQDAKDEYHITLLIALAIGLFQVLALVPGTSRSGITMTAAVLLGMSRSAAARFSFLLAIPVISGSAVFESITLLSRDTLQIAWFEMQVIMLLSALSALLCIHFFLRLIERIGFIPFVVYRLLLGAFLLVVFI